MKDANSLAVSPESTTPSGSVYVRLAVAGAVVVAMVFVGALGVRTLTSADLGYHLAYGGQLLRTGEIVDHDASIYTLPAEDLPAELRPEPGPGCWYDSDGRYRFPNANWLSQLVMAGAYAAGGITGLCVLSAVTVAAMFAVLLSAMRRLGAPWLLAAAGLVLVGLTSYLRLHLRPELFGYLMLAVQLWLLAPVLRDGWQARPLGWRAATGLVGVQVLFVNFHSYFMLGLALTGAVLVEQLLGWAWGLVSRRGDAGRQGRAALRMAIVLAGQAAVCFANPWTWRLAVLPVQTMMFLRQHDIASGASSHPWSLINEFRSLLSKKHFPYIVRDYAACVAAGLAVVAGMAALARRRIGIVLILAGMMAVGMSMVRNTAVAALVVVPVAMVCLRPWVVALAGRVRGRGRNGVVLGLAAVVALGSGYWGVQVVTNRLYFGENMSTRFGVGISRVALPVGAAEWLNENLPAKRVWCDFGSSSYLRFFGNPSAGVPVLTNTWAYPPSVAAEAITYGLAKRPFRELVDKYRFAAVVFNPDGCGPVFGELVSDPEWALVHVEGKHVVFVRAIGRLTDIAVKSQVTPASLRSAGYIDRAAQLDAVPAFPLLAEARIFSKLGWHDLAVEAATAAVADQPQAASAWHGLGAARSKRGATLRASDNPAWQEDFDEAARCFRRSLKIRPSYHAAQLGLTRLGRRWRE